MKPPDVHLLMLAVALTILQAVPRVTAAEETPSGDRTTAPAGLAGGLVVQLGADGIDTPSRLSRSGRYLVNVLDTNARAVAVAQSQLRTRGHYGLVSVEQLADPSRLPYAENLVNLVIVRGMRVPASELFRIVTPGGAVVATRGGVLERAGLESAGFRIETHSGSGLTARKPRPGSMDVWTHPRHAADGNAVSRDTDVAPPDRIRWVAGTTEEVEGIVCSGGRNYYGGVLARDSFNGLRLWHHDLAKAEFNAKSFRLPRLSRERARPVASDDHVFAVERGELVSLDAETGRAVQTFAGVSAPRELLHCDGKLAACDAKAVTAFNAGTGKQLWTFPATNARNMAARKGLISFIQGDPEGKTGFEAVALELDTGREKWRRSDLAWLRKTVRTVLNGDCLAFEVSSLNDHDTGNALHILRAETGDFMWSKAYPPGMNHNRQARAMFSGDDLWILHGGKTNTVDRNRMIRTPVQVSSLDPGTGKTNVTYPAGLAHCFPPVATPNYMLSGVLDFTDLKTGKLTANPITKANCSRENGWVPANGLIYTTPKHCTCWPILRGFTALAPGSVESGKHIRRPVEEPSSPPQKGEAYGSIGDRQLTGDNPLDWPLYRHDRWRSGSSTAPGPESLKVRWSTSLSGKPLPDGPILHDWRENEFVKGPVSAPVIADSLVYVARPDAHEVLAVDADTGEVSWRFTANGRVDLPPAIHRGICIFGVHSGSVYALRADNGKLMWRLRAAPLDERIVAYGQVESPWPVAGAVLVENGIVYFAAGRQPLADGGIFIFAVEAETGKRLWTYRLDNIPQKGFYENSGLEFDPVDILHREDDGIALSRWVFSRDGKQVNVDKWNAFAKLDTGGGAVWIPRGCWTYGPRHQDRFRGEAPRRPLCVFRDHTVLSSFNGSTKLFRRDFDIENGEKFNSRWITGWEAGKTARNGGNPFRTYRLAEKSSWQTDPFTPESKQKKRSYGMQLSNELSAMALAGDGRLFVVHNDGRLKAISASDGSVLDETELPPPAWDSMAIANRRLYVVSQSGKLICVGE